VRAYEFLYEGGLSPSTFDGHPGRWNNFLKRVDRSDNKGGRFDLVNGGTVVIDNVPEIIDGLNLSPVKWPKGRKKDGTEAAGIAFPINGSWEKRKKNEDGTMDYSEVQFIALGHLQKTNDFGRTGGEGGENFVGDENEKLDILNQALTELKGDAKEIEIIVGDRPVMAARFDSTPKQKSCRGDCKADWTVLDASNKEVAWISHKKYNESKIGKEGYSHAADFFGWGGVSDPLMNPVYEKFPELKKEIYKFASDIKKLFPGESEGENVGYYKSYNKKGVEKISSLPKIGKPTEEGEKGEIDPYGTGLWVYRKIINGLIRAISVYGVGFGGERGLQNVDLILQGVPSFNNETPPRLISNGGIHSNGVKGVKGATVPDRLEDDYEPVLVAKYNPTRHDFSKHFDFKGVRFSIFPIGAVTTRKGAGAGTVEEI